MRAMDWVHLPYDTDQGRTPVSKAKEQLAAYKGR